MIHIDEFYSNNDKRTAGQCSGLTQRYISEMVDNNILVDIKQSNPNARFFFVGGPSSVHFSMEGASHAYFVIDLSGKLPELPSPVDFSENILIVDPLNGNCGRDIKGYSINTLHEISPTKPSINQSSLNFKSSEELPIPPIEYNLPMALGIGLTKDGNYSVAIGFSYARNRFRQPIRATIYLGDKESSHSWSYGLINEDTIHFFGTNHISQQGLISHEEEIKVLFQKAQRIADLGAMNFVNK
ncbi:MAG: hypothetical protein Q9M91_06265 [Candidatus Dojkabacteria bacterium]|nr:hypothetical protein [Candidatus Dojkabacteria bacterium]MDQ7021401.1 hypothetical protein [Candidatus Dojkabacteria bacterium]